MLLILRLGRYADNIVEGAIAKATESVEMSGEGDGRFRARGCEDMSGYNDVEGGWGGEVQRRRGRGKSKA